MSIGDTKSYGNKDNNFPWQLKMLQGQQCACDYLKEIDLNTDQIEPLLAQILIAIQNGTDYEAVLVVDSAGVTWLEIRIWNGTTFNPPVYYLAGSNVPGIPVAPITYINPNTYLALISSYTSNLVGMAAALNAIQNDATFIPAIVTNTNPNTRTATFIRDTASLTAIPQCTSVSFASVGTANALINGVSLSPGQTINFDAGSLNNYFLAGTFTADTFTISGSELLITYIA
jgi:hypothetical protein